MCTIGLLAQGSALIGVPRTTTVSALTALRGLAWTTQGSWDRFWLLTNFLLRHLELLRLLVTSKNLGGFFNPFQFFVFAVIYQESFDLNTNRYPWHMPGISADIRGICPGYRQISVAAVSRAYAGDICRY